MYVLLHNPYPATPVSLLACFVEEQAANSALAYLEQNANAAGFVEYNGILIQISNLEVKYIPSWMDRLVQQKTGW